MPIPCSNQARFNCADPVCRRICRHDRADYCSSAAGASQFRADEAFAELAAECRKWKALNRQAVEALQQAEACMSIVEPRSDKAEYLRILGVIRAALDATAQPVEAPSEVKVK